MKLSARQVLTLLVAAAVLLLAPVFTSSYITGVLSICMIYAIWAMGWDFFSGLTGRENFGYPLFIGIGGYCLGYLNVNHGISPWWCLAMGALGAAVVGVLIGLPTLRLKGPYFALATLAASSIVQRLLLVFWEVSGGEEGIQGVSPLFLNPLPYYYFLLGAAVLSGVLLVGLASTRWGILLRAIRGDEAACQAAGIGINFYKVAALAISAGFAGLGGAMYAGLQQQVSPQIMGVSVLVSVVTMVYVGGLGSVYGAAAAAVLLSLLGEMLRGFGPYRLLVYALLLIAVIFFMRQGLFAPLWRRLGAPAPDAPTVPATHRRPA
jgi:branched-chain amino acid transport system permease protein